MNVLVHIRLNLSQPYQMSGSWAFFIIAISLKFYVLPCALAKRTWCHFLQVAIAWAKQAKLVLKNIFFDKKSYRTQPHNVKWLISFVTTILPKLYSPSCAKLQITCCWFLHVIVVRMYTKLWMPQHKKKNCFLTAWLWFVLSCWINSAWFLMFFAYFHANVFQILRKSTCGHWMHALMGKLSFIKA